MIVTPANTYIHILSHVLSILIAALHLQNTHLVVKPANVHGKFIL